MAVKPGGERTDRELPDSKLPEPPREKTGEAVGRGSRVPGGPPRLRKRKFAAPPPPAPGGVQTLAERLRRLPSLPSLKKPAADSQSAQELVDVAAPPPKPHATTESQPGAGVDRGMPIPDNYGLDRLVVMVRDPYWVFLYWELHGGLLARLRSQRSAEVLQKARWVLRVKAVGDWTGYYVDIQLDAANWYLKVAPNTRFLIDLGFLTQSGDFVLALRGNEVRTPNCSISDVVDERWTIQSGDLAKLLASTGLELSRAPAPHQPRALELFSSYLAQSERHGGAEKRNHG